MRFDYSRERLLKRSDAAAVSTALDLSFAAHSETAPPPLASPKAATTYSLRAVVWHRGGDASFGHYLADVQRARGAAEYWERYDDTAVTRRAAMITPATAVGPHATAVTNGYLFFYVSDGLGL
ncbi:hypothetical protein EMIHUDRAFT_223962 [Emiliania huxleyi CCMP1516]|uniref:USP domain-containing protein n=2 Tax=Emiliania huxleyi TaxID=2903 RepID=A0A0D3KTJ2_EMIH1|nr:hypothetical protein EMIHUDRAFT_223962 [Emiliania huxleyi CCMP1516]EOD39077.1 hypothetical protein EMIHUDRAFT_223962 [Emiliania huxleyi CCMP1516]|eukprot:XP_005791506.1 hypothetical protein EMIHUDRAFT_223962 [Emiliania huxleyi CCMP1516]